MPERFVLGPEQERGRVDKILSLLMPGISRARIQSWIAEGRVSIDGRACRARDPVGPGNLLEVVPGPPPPSLAEPEPGVALGVLWEDEHLIVVDKPAGLVVHPARGHWTGTLVGGLLAHVGAGRPPPDPRDPAGALRPGIVQRLDKDTSGCLVVAKDARAREGLKAQLARHDVERAYLALTLGVPAPGTIRTLHARHPRSRLRFTSRTRTGKPAVTHLEPLEPLAGGRAALVRCRLETGRTHQIRVHLAEQTRTPLLGDALYGCEPADPDLAAVARTLGRQALHAAVLGFVHPVTDQRLRVESALPADLAHALARLREM